MKRLVCLLTVFLLASTAFAQSRLDEAMVRGVLRVGTTGDYKPFSFRGDNDEFVGLDVEMAADLARILGVRLELVPTAWPSLMKDYGENRFDLAMSGVSVNLERQKHALFSVPYLRDGKTPITRCENKDRFQTLAQIDRSGVRLIVNPGGTNERFARTHVKQATITVYPDNVTIFDRIVVGEADLMITDAIETRLQQKLRPALCAVHPEAPFDYSEKAVLLPRDFLLKAFVDQWLHQMLASGGFASRLERWLAYPWELEPVRQLMDRRLGMMVDVARHKWNSKVPIEDLVREAQIIAGLTQQAAAMGLSSAWAEAFFRAQIEAAKTIQREHFARWETEKAGAFENVPDLATVLRPQLDALTPKLLRALAANEALLRDPARRVAAAKALLPLRAVTLSPTAAKQALAPLVEAP